MLKVIWGICCGGGLIYLNTANYPNYIYAPAAVLIGVLIAAFVLPKLKF